VRAVVQRVRRARVTVGTDEIGAIGPGLCVLVAAGPADTDASAAHLADRVATLRVFGDDAGRMNLDVAQAGGAVLVVSQFTLYADTTRGHRPSFLSAAKPELAVRLCEVFASALRARGLEVATGSFGAQMAVALVNDGPVTVVLSSGEPGWETDAG
jgi:D-tyrosyl-tRNA(Tyr) deacylase